VIRAALSYTVLIVAQRDDTTGGNVKFRKAQRRRLLLCAAIGVVVTLAATSASAVIIDSGDGTGNTTAPADDPGWSNIGIKSGLGVVYLRNGWVITANHVGAGDILLDGSTYTYVPGTAVQLDDGAGTLADLVVFGITPLPAVADLPIRTNTSLPTVDVIMAGRGRNRGAVTDSDGPGVWMSPPANPTPAHPGYYWGATSALRWGTNKIVDHWPFLVPTVTHYTLFDEPGPDYTTHESQATMGDSGGAVFAKEGLTWELSGIIWAIAPFLGQIANTSALEGNATLIVDLSFYSADINAITAIPVPEPSALLQLGVGAMLTRLMYWRRSRA
jgi:hypothetical protein